MYAIENGILDTPGWKYIFEVPGMYSHDMVVDDKKCHWKEGIMRGFNQIEPNDMFIDNSHHTKTNSLMDIQRLK
jgi:hypothetical protein